MKSFEFNPDRKTIVAVEDGREETNEVEDQTEGHFEDEDYEEVEFKCDDPATENEIAGLQGEVEDRVASRAMEMGITEEEELNKFLALAELDLASLDKERLDPLNLKKGEVMFIKESVNEALSKCWRNKSGDVMVRSVNVEKLVRFTEFIEKHSKAISAFMLADYCMSFGSIVLKDLAAACVEVEKIPLNQLNNPETLKKIDLAASTGSPIDIMNLYSPENQFKENESGYSFGLSVKTVEQNDNTVQKTILLDNIFWNTEQQQKLESDLEAAGISLSYQSGGYPIEQFFENKEKITEIFSQDLGIEKEKVAQYFENFFFCDTSKLTVVPYEDFQVNSDLSDTNDTLELAHYKEDIYKQFQVNDENGHRNNDNWLKAEKELSRWWSENNPDSNKTFDEALSEEKQNYDNSPAIKLEKLKVYEQQTESFNNSGEFRAMFLQDLAAANYTIDDLKEKAQDDPKAVFEIIAEVIGKNVDYYWTEYCVIEAINFADEFPDGTPGKQMIKNTGMAFMNDKYADGEPYEALSSHKTVCHGYGKTYTAAFAYAKDILEEEGVPFDNVVCLWTTSDAENHLWNALVTVDDKGNLVITYIDPTWHDFGTKLNAVDDDHYYGGIKEKIDSEHAATLENIKTWNTVILQQKLTDIVAQNDLSKYDPRSHKKEVRVKLNHEAYLAFKKAKEEGQTEAVGCDEESSIARIMERIRKSEGEEKIAKVREEIEKRGL